MYPIKTKFDCYCCYILFKTTYTKSEKWPVRNILILTHFFVFKTVFCYYQYDKCLLNLHLHSSFVMKVVSFTPVFIKDNFKLIWESRHFIVIPKMRSNVQRQVWTTLRLLSWISDRIKKMPLRLLTYLLQNGFVFEEALFRIH